MAKFVNDEGVFESGFEQHLPEELRDYAKQFKNLPDALKSGLDNQREFRARVKLPTDEDGKRKFVQEHFKDVLEADAAAARKAQEDAAAASKTQAEADAAKAAAERLATSQANAKKVLGGDDAKAVETNTELARRAFRSDHCPEWIKTVIAEAAGVAADKLTDEQIKLAIASEPAVAQTLLTVGKLTGDGRMETGDGHTNRTGEKEPAYPHNPEFYRALPDNDPEKRYFINRGAKYENGAYRGGYAVTKA